MSGDKMPGLKLEGTYYVAEYEGDDHAPTWHDTLEDAYGAGDAACVIYQIWVGAVVDVKRV